MQFPNWILAIILLLTSPYLILLLTSIFAIRYSLFVSALPPFRLFNFSAFSVISPFNIIGYLNKFSFLSVTDKALVFHALCPSCESHGRINYDLKLRWFPQLPK